MQFVAPPNVGDVIDQKYVLDSQLGQGGMGTVFAGRSMETGERVAIKVMLDVGEATEEVKTRFMNEAHLALRKWMAAHRRESAGHSGEIYGDPTPDPADTETTVVYLVK